MRVLLTTLHPCRHSSGRQPRQRQRPPPWRSCCAGSSTCKPLLARQHPRLQTYAKGWHPQRKRRLRAQPQTRSLRVKQQHCPARPTSRCAASWRRSCWRWLRRCRAAAARWQLWWRRSSGRKRRCRLWNNWRAGIISLLHVHRRLPCSPSALLECMQTCSVCTIYQGQTHESACLPYRLPCDAGVLSWVRPRLVHTAAAGAQSLCSFLRVACCLFHAAGCETCMRQWRQQWRACNLAARRLLLHTSTARTGALLSRRQLAS